jgi:glycosyltransferase involved in cell wall biosynthesis
VRAHGAADDEITRNPDDFVVTWLQNDYGHFGRSAECIAHALLNSRSARRAAFVQPPVGLRHVRHKSTVVRGLDVHQVTRRPRPPPRRFARAVLRRSGLFEPILLNCGLGQPNWYFHQAFAPYSSKTVLVVHDRLELWPGLSQKRRSALSRVRAELLEASDVVVGLSEGSISDVPGAHYVGHGCDEFWANRDLFVAPEPPDLAGIPRPRAVYLGNLSARICEAAFETLAASGVHVVLIGFGPTPALGRLIAQHPRVHWLGARHPSEAAPYLMHCDVGIVPHTNEPFTRSMEPHKVYNYSSAGIPSVTLNCVVPEALSPFIIATSTVSEFVEATHLALRRGGLEEDAIREARTLTWSRVASQIVQLVGCIGHGDGREEDER